MEENVISTKPKSKYKGAVILTSVFFIAALLLFLFGVIFFSSFRSMVEENAAKAAEDSSASSAIGRAIGIGFAAIIVIAMSIACLGGTGILSTVGLGVSIAKFRKVKTSQRYYFLTVLIGFALLLVGAITLFILLFVLK